MKVFILSTMLFAFAMAAPGIIDNQVGTEGSYAGLMKVIGNCADSDDTTTCLAVKGITALNRAARSQSIELIPGVTFTRSSSESVRAGKALSENEILTNLPTEIKEKNGRLLDLALESASNFLGSHNVQFTVPAETTKSVARAIETGRVKVKKFIGPVLLAVGAKIFALLPLLFGGVFLLVLKAVFVSKLALVLAAVLAFQKLSSGGSSGLPDILGKVTGGGSGGWANSLGGGGSSGGNSWGSGSGSQQGWANTGTGSSASYPYARSYDAQDLAYKGQAEAAPAVEQ